MTLHFYQKQHSTTYHCYRRPSINQLIASKHRSLHDDAIQHLTRHYLRFIEIKSLIYLFISDLQKCCTIDKLHQHICSCDILKFHGNDIRDIVVGWDYIITVDGATYTCDGDIQVYTHSHVGVGSGRHIKI